MNKIIAARRQAALNEVSAALTQANGCVTDAARLLGTHPQTVHNWIRRLGLNASDYRIQHKEA